MSVVMASRFADMASHVPPISAHRRKDSQTSRGQGTPRSPSSLKGSNCATVLKNAKPILLQLLSSLKAWASPRQNPFVAQAVRALARRHLGHRLAFWFAVWFVAAWGTAVWVESTVGHEIDVPLVGAQTALAVSWLWAFCIARFRLSSTLQSEWLKERLVPILLSPMSPEAVAAIAGAPAVLLGLFVSAFTLPVWALGLGCGFLNPLDAWGFTLLILLSCLGFPAWSSATWEAQLNAKAAANTSATKGKTASSPVTPPASASQASLSASLFLSLFSLVSALFTTIPREAFSSLETWVLMWPAEITSLSSHFYAFPLLVARLLVYPLPFFAWSLPLWIALAPFWVNGLRTSHAYLSCALEARRDSAKKRALRVAAIWRPIRGLWAPLLAGFLLPVAYQSFWLGAWRGSTRMFPSKWGVEADVTIAWWHLVIALGAFTLSTWLRVRTTKIAIAQHSQNWDELFCGFKHSARRVVAGVFLAGTLGPLLCGRNPFPLPLPLFLVQMAPVAATWMTLQIAFAREYSTDSKGFKPVESSRAQKWLIWLWMYGAPLLLMGGSFAWSWGALLISPLSWPFCLMSPVTLWFAPRFDISLNSPLFYGAAIVHLALAALLWRRISTLRAPVVATPAQSLESARREAVAAFQMVLEARQSSDFAPRVVADANDEFEDFGASEDALEINTPETAALRTATRLPLPTPTPEQERFLERFGRFDNALLRLELRRAMGKTEWIQSARQGAKVGPILIVFFSILFPSLVFLFALLFGPPKARAGTPPGFTDMEWIFFAFVGLGLFITCLEIGSRTSALYDRDRLDGSLDFLFLTPLETRAIIAGKIVPPLLRGAVFLAAYWPTFFTIALLLSLFGEHRSWPFALLAPVAAWALTARAVAWLHLLGVAKTNSKPVYFFAMLGLFAVPVFVGLCAMIGAPMLELFSRWEVPATILLLLSIALCLLDCLWPHRLSVRLLERERVRR